MCRNSNINIQRKEVTKNTLEKNGFSVFFGLWQEKFVFLPGSFWQGCQNYFLCIQRNTYRATFLKGSLQKLRIFAYLPKFSGEWRKTFFRVGETALDVRGNRLWENRFQKRKNRCFFPILSDFLLLAKKNSADLRNPQSMYRWNFLWKNIFWKVFIFFQIFHTSLEFGPINP